MNITIELTGIAPLADAINNLADALKAGAKADEVIASAKTRAKKPKTEEASAPTEATPVVSNPGQAAAEVEEKVEASPEPEAADPTTPTAEDARKAVLAVAKAKGHDAASALLAKFGAKKISELKEADFGALIEASKAE